MSWRRRDFLAVSAAASVTACVTDPVNSVVVYGATPAGIAAAIAARRRGAQVLLVEPTDHVGGRFADSLGFDEVNRMDPASVGGLFAELRGRVDAHYGESTLLPEPHVHERLLGEWLADEGVDFLTGSYAKGFEKSGERLVSMATDDGHTIRGDVFVDASYMGDLLPLAGVDWTAGREAAEQYGESLAGVRRSVEAPGGTPPVEIPVFASRVNGRGEGGDLLPLMQGELDAYPPDGSGDKHLQAANMLTCMSKDPANRIAIEKPADYEAAEFEILRRELARVPDLGYGFGKIPNAKGKMNESIARLVHWGYVGQCDDYPTATVQRRREIWESHRRYTHRILWFLGNDAGVPEALRESVREWGLAADEFTDNDQWPRGLYVREGRRLVGDYVMTQEDIYEENRKRDSIALGGFPVDSHAVRRLASNDGVVNEGGFLLHSPIYEIPYRALLPKRAQCSNLLSPTAASLSRVVYCSVRVEPTWMALGEAAGTAAALASRAGVSPHALPIDEMQMTLPREGLPVRAG